MDSSVRVSLEALFALNPHSSEVDDEINRIFHAGNISFWEDIIWQDPDLGKVNSHARGSIKTFEEVLGLDGNLGSGNTTSIKNQRSWAAAKSKCETLSLAYVTNFPSGVVGTSIAFYGFSVPIGHSASARFVGVGANTSCVATANGVTVYGQYRDRNGNIFSIVPMNTVWPDNAEYLTFQPAAAAHGVNVSTQSEGGNTGINVGGKSYVDVQWLFSRWLP